MAEKPRKPPDGKVRYAVVGLGWIAQGHVLPAFANAEENSVLAALISGDPAKHTKIATEYRVRYTCSYADYDECMRSGEIDAVYIALPNSLHKEYTIRAAQAGVHVLCEKPMAVTEDDCEEMILTCAEEDVKLMIAYRLHFEEANLQAIDIAASGQLGEVRAFTSTFTQLVAPGNVRLKKSLGGGTVDDMGVYCINAARYLFRDEPVEVRAAVARGPDPRFREVEEMTSAVLRFPGDRLATFLCSFGAEPVSTYQLLGTKGSLRLDPAYGLDSDLTHYLTLDGKTTTKTYKRRDQFAAELLYFSDCILKDIEPEPSGAEGLADVRIIRALYRAAESGKPVALKPISKLRRPSLDQAIYRPASREPELVNAAGPTGAE